EGFVAFEFMNADFNEKHEMPALKFSPAAKRIPIEEYAYYVTHWQEDYESQARARAPRGKRVEIHQSSVGSQIEPLELNYDDLQEKVDGIREN
ncbi:MAG: hypothetical protein HG428_000890, partial [Bacteroidia bacterium]|nr:hypothetical protein [Bacteroidia bacterium]